MASSSRAFSPCGNVPTSLPLMIVTPASSAALKLAFFRCAAGESGLAGGQGPAPAVIVGHSATWCSTISLNTSGVPSPPCSIVSTPASAARRIPSAVFAWTATGTPALFAVSTASFSSSIENVGREPAIGPQR